MTLPMSVKQTRRSLLALAIVSGLLWSAAAALIAVAVARMVSPAHDVATGGAIAAAAIAALAVAWRWKRVRDPAHVALWMEEQEPALQYAVVTRVEPRFAGLGPDLDEHITRAGFPHALPAAWRRVLLLPAVALVLAAAGWLLAPRLKTVVQRGGITGSAVPGREGPFTALAGITVRIQPPAYSRQRAHEQHDPETIRGLVGSAVTVTGRVRSEEIAATLADGVLQVSGEEWSTSFTMPASPAVLRLRHQPTAGERVIVVEPVRDEPPRVVLEMPARDTTLLVPPRSIRVVATVRDDIGLASGMIEYVISSGQEATYTARGGVVAQRQHGGARSGRLDATLDNGSLQLRPGDFLSIRAVARDGNTVSGPGVGASETRTIRIARSDEYDPLSIEAMGPLVADSAFLSQRMLLRMTVELVSALPSLTRDSVVRRSTVLGRDQERLRDRVHEVVFPGHEHEEDEVFMEGEPPDHAEPADPVNVDLKEAYESMWEAARELRVASPQTAVPHMRVAVAALDRARLANRVYLRGGTPRVVVDLARVRLAGTDRGSSSARVARPTVDTLLSSLVARLERIAMAVDFEPQVRANRLGELRVELLRISPGAAEALAAAAAALRAGRDPASALAQARRELTGAPVERPVSIPWSGW